MFEGRNQIIYGTGTCTYMYKGICLVPVFDPHRRLITASLIDRLIDCLLPVCFRADINGCIHTWICYW